MFWSQNPPEIVVQVGAGLNAVSAMHKLMPRTESQVIGTGPIGQSLVRPQGCVQNCCPAAGPTATQMPVVHCASLAAAVAAGAQAAEPGDIVLLAPACASFDMFENFEARGDAFRAAVEALA